MTASSVLPVEVRGLAKRFGEERALAGVSLELRGGEVTALLGPNGAGKSTLIGILSLLTRPSAGTVVYGGRVGQGGAQSSAIRRRVGLVAHEPLLYGDLTGAENLALFARLYDVPDSVARARALLTRFGLAHAGHRPLRTYSRGMTQRLALCRALLHQPEIILLDEPFTGLDAEGTDVLGDVLREERAAGHALLVTTHDVTPLAGLCDHAVVLRRGRVTADERCAGGPLPLDRLRALQRGAPPSAVIEAPASGG